MDLNQISLIPKDKKGLGIGDIYPIVLTIAIVAILLAVVLFILVEFGDQVADTDYRVSNESFNLSSFGARVSVAATACNFKNFVVISVNNHTIATESGNYTTNSTNVATNSGYIFMTGTSEYNGSLMNATYDYTAGTESCQATKDIIQDFVDFIPWIGIILLIVAAAIVIGIVIRSFAGGSKSRV